MPRQGQMMEGLMVPTKIRKRGCSSSSSSPSRIHNKRAILRGKNRAGLGIALGRSRSSTPVPTWRTTPLRSAIDSPKHSQSGKYTRPVSARRLAASLWEMNEMPSPKMSEANLEAMKKKNGSKMAFKKDKLHPGWGLHLGPGSGLSYLPPHLSDPSSSPSASEAGRRRTPSQRVTEKIALAVDSISHASFMEIESRSRPPTSSGSVSGCRIRLKDVSNALTTSKELLKIITRIWGNSDHQPSTNMSLITALHAELERARLQVNHLVQEQRVDKNEIGYVMKRFAEEKASWKSKEQQVVETAVASVAGELEVERKLRQRLESLNKKLGKELLEIKSSLVKAVKELESEKRAREVMEKVCEELVRNIDGDEAVMEKLKRVQKKLPEAKGRFEESSSAAIGKLRKQLEVYELNGREDDGKVDEDGIDRKEGSGESDLLELNVDSKGQKWGYASVADRAVANEIKPRNSILEVVSLRNGPLQRSASDGLEVFDRDGLYGLEREAPRRSYYDGTQRNRSVKVLVKDHKLSSSRLSLSQKNEQSWPSRDPFSALEERSSAIQTTSSKSRTAAESHGRRSKW